MENGLILVCVRYKSGISKLVESLTVCTHLFIVLHLPCYMGFLSLCVISFWNPSLVLSCTGTNSGWLNTNQFPFQKLTNWTPTYLLRSTQIFFLLCKTTFPVTNPECSVIPKYLDVPGYWRNFRNGCYLLILDCFGRFQNFLTGVSPEHLRWSQNCVSIWSWQELQELWCRGNRFPLVLLLK